MNPVMGVVLPIGLSDKWLDVYVRVKESGNQIILESGALPQPMNKTMIRVNSKKLEVIKI